MKNIIILSLLTGTVLHAQTKEDTAILWKLYTDSRYEDMAMLAGRCLSQDSSNYQYAYLKGKAMEGMFRYKDAIEAQRLALRLSNGNADAMSALAGLYLASGQSHASAVLYRQLAVREPNVTHWKINEAKALQTSGKFHDAVIRLRDASHTDSLNWVIFKNMGDCWQQMDSMQQAAVCYRKALDLYPDNIQLYGHLSRLYLRIGNLDKAVETSIRAITADSTFADGWKNAGVAWYRKEMLDSSKRAFDRALMLHDSSLLTNRYAGMLYFRTFDYANAEKYLSKAYAADSTDMSTIYYLAAADGYVGKAMEGIALLDLLDQMLDRYDTIRLQAGIQRGYLYKTLEKYDLAARTFGKIHTAVPHKAIYVYEVASSHDMAHRKKQALDWYIRFLNQIDPDWETTEWTEPDKKKPTYQNIAMERIKALKTELFFEEGATVKK
jgi:tetratricopeptide (TPR) repeat protein